MVRTATALPFLPPLLPVDVAERYEALCDEYGDLVDPGTVNLPAELLVAYDQSLTRWCPDPLVRGREIRALVRRRRGS